MDQKVLNRNKRIDAFAAKVIRGGGIVILACVIGVLLMLLSVTLPLFSGSEKELLTRFPLQTSDSNSKPLAIGVGKYLESAYWIGSNGEITFIDLVHGKPLEQERLASPITSLSPSGKHQYSLTLQDGSARLIDLSFNPDFNEDGEDRKILHEVQELAVIPREVFEQEPLEVQIVQSEEATLALTRLSSRSLQLVYTAATEGEDSLMAEFGMDDEEEDSGETEDLSFESVSLEVPVTDEITAFFLGRQGRFAFAGTQNGKLFRWDITDPEEVILTDEIQAFSEERSITAMTQIYGEESLAIGDSSGQVTTWMPAQTNPGNSEKTLTLIHYLAKHHGPVTEVRPSFRHKSLFSLSEESGLIFDHMTSESELLTFEGSQFYGFSPRGNGLIQLSEKGQISLWKVDTPHPESSWGTFFSKLWYESYDQPEYLWQSSSGSDDFEAKLSLIPLIFGSIKGTLYAMIFALPLGIMAAVYTNEFASERFHNIVKPSVEITAAVPSVIIGFMAALWLAPIIDSGLLPFFIFWPVLTLLFVGFLVLWSKLREIKRFQFLERGLELSILIPLILFAFFLTLWLSPIVEAWFFGGDFKTWIYDNVTQNYDQRNSIIISFGLGFIVIPFIYTMTDDALSSVPPSLKAASMALGASRWQTLWKVLLPSASPGIFAGVILGMGRAIGETMIVLMATGNTPIIDMSMFNGMRTLSANIAVEIPEAPVDGTLYRTLFLSAMILFGFTFILNSLAEIVRTYLRKKYGQF